MHLEWRINGDENNCEDMDSGVYHKIIEWLQEKKVLPQNWEDFNQQHMDNLLILFKDYTSNPRTDERVIKPVKDEEHTVALYVSKRAKTDLELIDKTIFNIWNWIDTELIENTIEKTTDETILNRLKPYGEQVREQYDYWHKLRFGGELPEL
ncbi:hypothetical protein ACXX84_03605 [Mycoplasma sp. AC157]